MYFTVEDMRVLMVGLDSSGKTTILYKLKVGDLITTISTIGFNIETLEYNDLSLTILDIGGQDSIRPIWTHYYENVVGIIFVVDSTDRQRIDDSQGFEHSAKLELHTMLAEESLRDAILLIFANKQDYADAMSVAEVARRLNLQKIRHRTWHIQGSSVPTGDGIYEGFDWLVREIKKITSDEA